MHTLCMPIVKTHVENVLNNSIDVVKIILLLIFLTLILLYLLLIYISVDYTRVKLNSFDDEEDSDFINANYIAVSNLYDFYLLYIDSCLQILYSICDVFVNKAKKDNN